MALIPTDRLGEAAQAVAQAYAEHGFAEPRFCRWWLVSRRIMTGLSTAAR